MDDRPRLYPLSHMARRLGVTAAWLRSEAEAGRLPCLRADSRLLFVAEAVERVLVERATESRQSAEAALHA